MGAYNVAGRYGEWGDRPHPEQGFRACLGIVRLTKPFGAGRVEPAAMPCARGVRKAGLPVCATDAYLQAHKDIKPLPDCQKDRVKS
jgi:hypothetical protein